MEVYGFPGVSPRPAAPSSMPLATGVPVGVNVAPLVPPVQTLAPLGVPVIVQMFRTVADERLRMTLAVAPLVVWVTVSRSINVPERVPATLLVGSTYLIVWVAFPLSK